MNKLKKMKDNVKGFTLVEIIVVLLILAILAAIAIPSMLGYVNEARNSENIAEARTGYVAAQTVATQQAAAPTTPSDADIAKYVVDAANLEEINKYIGNDSKVTSVKDATVVNGRLTKLTVTITVDGSDKTVVFADGEAKMKD